MIKKFEEAIKEHCVRCAYHKSHNNNGNWISLCSSGGENTIKSEKIIYATCGIPYETFDPLIIRTYINVAGCLRERVSHYPYPRCEDILADDDAFKAGGTCQYFTTRKPRVPLTGKKIVSSALDFVEGAICFVLKNAFPLACISYPILLGTAFILGDEQQALQQNVILQERALIKDCLCQKGLSVDNVDLRLDPNKNVDHFSYTDKNEHTFALTNDKLTETKIERTGPHTTYDFGPRVDWRGRFKTSPGLSYSSGGEMIETIVSVTEPSEFKTNPRIIAMQQCLQKLTQAAPK